MMTDRQRAMMEKLGLTESQFKPSNESDKERIEILEDAFADLCDVVFGGELDG